MSLYFFTLSPFFSVSFRRCRERVVSLTRRRIVRYADLIRQPRRMQKVFYAAFCQLPPAPLNAAQSPRTQLCCRSMPTVMLPHESPETWKPKKKKTLERRKTAITESETHRRKHHIHATKHSIYNTYCSFGHIWLESGPIRVVNEAYIYAQSHRQMDVKTESDGPFCSVVSLVGDLTGREWERSKKPHIKSSQPCQPCQLHHN